MCFFKQPPIIFGNLKYTVQNCVMPHRSYKSNRGSQQYYCKVHSAHLIKSGRQNESNLLGESKFCRSLHCLNYTHTHKIQKCSPYIYKSKECLIILDETLQSSVTFNLKKKKSIWSSQQKHTEAVNHVRLGMPKPASATTTNCQKEFSRLFATMTTFF